MLQEMCTYYLSHASLPSIIQANTKYDKEGYRLAEFWTVQVDNNEFWGKIEKVNDTAEINQFSIKIISAIYIYIYIRTYEGDSNENFESALKIQNTAHLSCKLTIMILMVWRVADRWQYDAGMQHNGEVVV
jgi:hypothetical protein